MSKRTTNRGAVALRDVMRKRKLTQADVSRALGVRERSSLITRWLSGERRPAAKNVIALFRIYKIRPESWFEDVPASDDEEPAAA